MTKSKKLESFENDLYVTDIGLSIINGGTEASQQYTTVTVFGEKYGVYTSDYGVYISGKKINT